jgi:sulfur-oxidizing protein SoxZ
MSTLKIRTKQQNDLTLVRVLMDHPMETGRRQDEATGEIVPAHYITDVKIEHNGQLLARGELSTAVSRNPYLSVRFRGGKAGDRVRVSWIDNLGRQDSMEAIID